jgi:hypothetical protein
MKSFNSLTKIAAAAFIAFLLITASIWADQVAVTIYNQNLGVVQETRTLGFDRGQGKLTFMDVPSQIDPTSVGFEILDPGKEAVILEQNYAYDLVSPDKIYFKYIDHGVDLFDEKGNLYGGTLLSYSGGSFVIKDNSGQIQIISSSQVVNANFPDLPEGLITRPTLFWLYASSFSGDADCRVSYQTGGMNWTAEYVGILADDEKTLDLTGWSSITNNSGATFMDATLKLVAGDIHRAAPEPRRMAPTMYEADISLAKAAGFEEKEFFEYHLYTLPRKATLANNEIKQIALFEPAQTTVAKKYLYQPDRNAKKVKVTINFTNASDGGLGMPLPAGRTRLFKADTDGSMILLGEDRIDHTPKDEELKLTVGYAFDISAEEKAIDYQRLSDRVEERTYEIEIRNHKKEDITVIVEKNLYGDWEIISTTHEYEKKTAGLIEFKVPVKADDKSVVNFRVRTTR